MVDRSAPIAELCSVREEASVRSLRRDIAALDQLHSDLAEDAPQDSCYPLYRFLVEDVEQRIQRKLNLADLLRLVNLIRSDLRLVLIRILSVLSRRPNAVSFALMLLASARCFGHRGESGDFVLPALGSISVGTG